jgi:NADH-quinone oxidoreductase subunit A
MEAVNAVPVFLYLAVLVGLALALFTIARIFTPRQYVGPVQKMPYESGMDPIHDTRRRFDVRFHLIAIAFLVFDVEVLFLYPWAVAAKQPESPAISQMTAADGKAGSSEQGAGSKTSASMLPAPSSLPLTPMPSDIDAAVKGGLASDRHIVFASAMVFIALLALGFVYDWKKGVFQWR